MTTAREALEDGIDGLLFGQHTDEKLSGLWTNNHYKTIIKALRILDALESGDLWAISRTIAIAKMHMVDESVGGNYVGANKSNRVAIMAAEKILERLKQIAEGKENDET